MSVFLSSGAGGTYDVTANLSAEDQDYLWSLVNSGRLSQADAQAFMDGDLDVDHLREIYGGTISTGITSQPGIVRKTPPTVQPQPKTDWGAWLQKNAVWIGAVVVGMVALPALLSGGRRR